MRLAPITIKSPLFWDGVAWTARWLIAIAHLLFFFPAALRPEILDGLPAYRLFEQVMPFSAWAGLSFLTFVVLVSVPTRVPFGLISTSFSAALWFLSGTVFSQGVGMIFGSLVCYGLGALGMSLFTRSLWAYAGRNGWFKRVVLRGHHDAG